MIFYRTIPPFLLVLLAAIVSSTGCGNREDQSTAAIAGANGPEIDWGEEVDLEEMIAMAKDNRIEEIQWHVMPNILRARTEDGTVYHLRNENKGVDLRSKLIEAGVEVGKNGVQFRHVF